MVCINLVVEAEALVQLVALRETILLETVETALHLLLAVRQ